MRIGESEIFLLQVILWWLGFIPKVIFLKILIFIIKKKMIIWYQNEY